MPESPSSNTVPAGHPFRRKGRGTDGFFKAFFAGNAGLTIVILILIIVFLIREGAGFFPKYREELEIYRRAGLEFVDIPRHDLKAHEQMTSLLNRAYYAQVNAACRTEFLRSSEATAVVSYINEAVTPAQSALLRVQENAGETGIPKELQDTLSAKYKELLAEVLAGKRGDGIPPTPHLTKEEREGLLAALAARDPMSTDDPPQIAAIDEQLSLKQAAAGEPLVELRATIDAFSESSGALDTLVSETGDVVKASKEGATLHEIEITRRNTLLEAAKTAKTAEAKAALKADALASVTTEPVDFKVAMEPVLARLQEFRDANAAMTRAAEEVLPKLPAKLEDEKADRYLSTFRKASDEYKRELSDTTAKMEAWKLDAPVGLGSTIMGFITGKDWITGGEWQDFYGIVPLFAGSLLIALIALSLAIPLGVGAAIYTNQLAGRREQNFIKPTIEFLQAIPSVVLGFLGIAVLGTILQETSMKDSFSWVPGFPIQQRLNMFTAGCLLGLMAIPTIFSLSEDALNNVPSAFAEASDALGASKLQTIFRVVLPAAVSGILAAVLLGLGRVIGETMVVLLVAGNRIEIPDFTEGLGVFFQPAHTLTGIIAQELGEVPFGSVHYRALFVVGMVLFAIVLGINWTAQRILHKFRTAHD
ncbi:phosphate ABC transporter permease subunit PstC [Luteolibacter sp. GHJ8]|uniref:Phosphate transport system permease protein n=1 Tax=Luteolibacter rhizosphaerae TaxID=2989719 RepID=A0ABT3G2H2_9BACT|nr:phosphate ABC transporter permease subunit PstC [Luteolibacter rhizosphaerae]MCW1914036.1 phosphate ABC transporter permease subunit PstC [Luteolibacter rhizosphaerae]